VMDSGGTFSDEIAGGFTYYIVTPIGPSGIGLLGDLEQFVPLGKQRITSVSDDGVLEMGVAFAPGETSRVITGYAAKAPVVTAQTGAVSSVSFDPTTQRFQFSVTASGGGAAMVEIAGN